MVKMRTRHSLISFFPARWGIAAQKHRTVVFLLAHPLGKATVPRLFGTSDVWRIGGESKRKTGVARSPTKAIPDQSLCPTSTPQHPVPCHSERALGRVELLRRAAKALWALAPCGIRDGLLACTFVPRDPRSEPFAPRPRFTRVSTRLTARSR